jgi:hypothetical protein
MSVIEEVRREREDLARVLKKHQGIRRIVEDLYPDSAHFIYELLQNAEDRDATHVRFTLSPDKLRFEHNGATFTPENIYAITDIGEGTKADDEDKVGRFGVGFKAVFAYSETPRIWSPTYSFEIKDLVLPSELLPQTELNGNTRFDFPFNNPKKSPADAYREIQTGLQELAETTLLFLRHIDSIKWEIKGQGKGEILRVNHDGSHIEILSELEDGEPTSLHFLKFEQAVEGLPKQSVAAAFSLDYVPSVSTFDESKPLREQLKIVPAAPGQVSIFFPAAKESSGLRFHVHAPFVPELSRASIKQTRANEPLFDQLAALIAQSLFRIRDLGVLNTDFLAILPNRDDQLGAPYERIRDAVIEAMNNEALTPTYSKTHAPAKYLYQAPASVKELLTTEDLQFLIGSEGGEEKSPQWAAGTMRGTDPERFMSSLSIRDWGLTEFVDRLYSQTKVFSVPEETFANFASWIGQKPASWHQRFYALLHRNSETPRLSWLRRHARIVRLSDGGYSAGNKCYFRHESLPPNAHTPTVDEAVYTSGKNESQQADARQFLITAGVTEIGERQLVKAVLEEHYSFHSTATPPSRAVKKNHLKHLARFITLYQDDPGSQELFSSRRFLIGEDNDWHRPSDIFLDKPYLETGLKEYYQLIGEDDSAWLRSLGLEDGKVALSDFYDSSFLSSSDLSNFAKALGAQTSILIEETTCENNPKAEYLYSADGARWRETGIDQDYTFPNFKKIIETPSLAISKLIWRTMMAPGEGDRLESDDLLQARFRWNRTGGSRYAPSQLVVQLANAAWVPQADRFVKPADAIAENLPKGFNFDAGASWLKAIEFGQNHALETARAKEKAAREVAERARKESAAQELGFRDIESAERGKRLAQIPSELAAKLLAEFERQSLRELPEQDARNPKRRSEAVFSEAMEAPEKQSAERIRSVRIGQADIKEGAKQYLFHQYNIDTELICQACKSAMPFKLNNGEYYFEAEPLFPDLSRLHRQNHLALCPNHAAMFRYALDSREGLQERIMAAQENELAITLAGKETTLYFTKNHLTDVRAILRAEKGLQAPDNGEIDE